MINRINKHWTNEEDMFLQTKLNEFTNKELSSLLGRSEKSIQHRLNLLFLKREPKQYAYYKNEKMVEIGTIEELAEHFGVKKSTIYWYSNPNNRRGNIAVVSLED